MRPVLMLGMLLLQVISFAGLANEESPRALPQPQLINFPFFVNSTSDAGNNTRDPTVCDDGTGHCTLRGAIQVANNQSGADTITIALVPGSVINLNSPLPNISGGLTINDPAGRVTV